LVTVDRTSMTDENHFPMRLTIRYVVEDDTFVVVDIAQNNRVLQGGFAKSSEAQRFADLLFEAVNKSAAHGEQA
jgi:hypothetical protein